MPGQFTLSVTLQKPGLLLLFKFDSCSVVVVVFFFRNMALYPAIKHGIIFAFSNDVEFGLC